MLFHGHDRTGFARSRNYRISVQWFDSVHIDDDGAGSLPFKLARGKKCVVHQRAGRKHHDFGIFAFPEYLRAAYLKGRLGRRHNMSLITGKTQVRGQSIFCDGKCRPSSLLRIAGRNDNHVRHRAHERDILQRRMRRPIGAREKPRMHPANLLRHIVDGNRRANLLPIAPRRKCRVRCDEWDFSVRSHSGADSSHILLGNTHFNETLGELFLEPVCARGLRQIRGQYDDARISPARLHNAFPETVARRGLFFAFKHIFTQVHVSLNHTLSSLRPIKSSCLRVSPTFISVRNTSSVTATDAFLICAPMHSRVLSHRERTACALINGFPPAPSEAEPPSGSNTATLPFMLATSKSPGSERKWYFRSSKS